MKIFLFIAALLNVLSVSSQKIVLEGTYKGENLYIQNPYSSDSGFCSQKVYVNSKEYNFEPASAFEIKLKDMNLTLGSKLEVVILHKPDCKPKVINTQPHNPKSDFQIISISIDGTWILKWKAKESGNKNPYFVEKFIDNKWVTVAEVDSWGSQFEREYRQQVTPSPGSNSFRVRQIDSYGKTMVSSPVTLLHLPAKQNFKKEIGLNSPRVSKGNYYTAYLLWHVNSWQLDSGSYSYLDSVVAFMKHHPKLVIEIGVHTDNRGSDKKSFLLTQVRAQSIVDYLVEKGIERERLKAFGYEASQLLYSDKDIAKAKTKEEQEELHAKNRRVTFKVLGETDK